MSTTHASGQDPDVSKLIQDYQSNPSKNTKSKNKALNLIESQINQLSSETLVLQSELEENYSLVQKGEPPLKPTRINQIRGDIAGNQEKLAMLKVQLAKLAKYKKSQKLADRILSLNISLGELDGRAKSINQAVTVEIPEANKIRHEIYALLKDANNKTNKKHSGELLYKAIQKYDALEGILGKLDTDSDDYRHLNAQMNAIRIRMTKIAKKQLPLSKEEKKKFQKYTQKGSLSEGKTAKLNALKMRVAVANAYFEIDQQVPVNVQEVLGDNVEAKNLVSDPMVSSPTNSNHTISSDLSTRRSKQKLRKKAKMRTKVRTYSHQKFTEGPVVKIASSVHQIGKRQMRTLGALQHIQMEYQTGFYEKNSLENVLKDVDALIKETEQELALLQSQVAAEGTTKLVEKVEKAISNSIGLVEELKAKKAELEPLVNSDFEQASKALKAIQDHVRDSNDSPKQAGFLLFDAYGSLEILKEHESSASKKQEEPGDKLVYEKITEMKKVAEALLNSTVKEKTLELSPREQKLTHDIMNKYIGDPTKAEKLLSQPDMQKKIEEILSKKITAALWGKSSEKDDLMIEIDQIRNFISINNPSLAEKINETNSLKPLIARYERDLGNRDRVIAVNNRAAVMKLLNTIKYLSSKNDLPSKLYEALVLRNQIEGLYESQIGEEQASLLGIRNDVDNKIKESGLEFLKLSSDKKKLRKKILKSDKPIKAKDYQIQRVIENEMMRFLLDVDPMGSDDKSTKVFELFDRLEKNNKGQFNEIFKTPPLKEMREKCYEKKINHTTQPCKVYFLQWAKDGKELTGKYKQLNEMSKELEKKFQDLTKGKKVISFENNEVDPEKNVDNLIKNINSILKDYEEGTVEYEALVKLRNFAENVVLQAYTKHKSSTQELKNQVSLTTKPLEELKKKAATSDQALTMLGTMTHHIDSPGDFSDAVFFGQLLRQKFEQHAAIASIYVDTFENSWIRGATDEEKFSRLKNNLEKLQLHDLDNKAQISTYLGAIDKYTAAYDNVDNKLRSVYEGSGPYSIKEKIELTNVQLDALRELEKMHNDVLGMIEGIQIKESEHSHLFQNHITHFKRRVTSRDEEVARIRANATGRVDKPGGMGRVSNQSLPFQPTRESVVNVPPQRRNRELSLHQTYRKEIGGKHVRSAPNQDKVNALLESIDRYAKTDSQHQTQWGQLSNCVNRLNETYQSVGDLFAGCYTDNGELFAEIPFDKSYERWFDYMEQMQREIGDELNQIQVDLSDQSSPLGAHFLLVKDLIQDKKDGVNALRKVSIFV